MNKKRIKYLDVAKAIGIILVIIGHVSQNRVITSIIYSFHMPLFFILSGYVYHKGNTKRKVKKILIPYFVFSIISYLYWICIERNLRDQNENPVKLFLNIFIARAGSENYLFNAVMWFLPCLLVTQLMFEGINKFIKNKYIKVIMIVLLSIMGYILGKIEIFRLPFTLDVAFMALLFYSLGYWLRLIENKYNLVEKINKSLKNRIRTSTILVFLFICLIGLVYINGPINMNEIKYNIYLLSVMNSCIGSAIIIIISVLIDNNKILEYIGKNTLIIMCTHEPIKRVLIYIVSKVLKMDQEVLRNNVFYIMLISLLLLIICLIITLILKKTLKLIKKNGAIRS